MKKIVSQIAGAVAVVSAATFAFAQTSDQNVAGENRSAQPRTSNVSNATANGTDLKSSETGSRFGPGGNNGSTYNSAIRSTDIKAGNVSSVEDPIVDKTTAVTPAAPAAPVAAATPEPAPVDAAPAAAATPEPMPAPAVATTDTYDRPARADRN